LTPSPNQVKKKRSIFFQKQEDQEQQLPHEDNGSYYTEEDPCSSNEDEDDLNQVEHLIQSNDQEGLRELGALRVRATMKGLKG